MPLRAANHSPVTPLPAKIVRESSVTFVADAGWAALLAETSRVHQTDSAESRTRREFREELGLPSDRAIVMSGHQATLWHPGIAAKLFALRSLAKATGATPVWLVVDTDDGDVTSLRMPLARGAHAAGNPADKQASSPASSAAASANALRAKTISLETGAKASLSRVPTAMRDAGVLRVPGTAVDQAHEAVRGGLARLSEVLARESAQGHASLAKLLTSVQMQTPGLAAAFDGVAIVYTSQLAQTTAFGRVCDALAGGESSAIGAASPHASTISGYNAAAAKHPQARMRQLTDEARVRELPLWWLARNMPRAAVKAMRQGDGEDGKWLVQPPDQERAWHLAPRALMTTLLMRQFGCELFIHGLGGGVYDQVLASWIEISCERGDALSHVLTGMSPAVVVSATLRLPLASDADSAVLFAATQAATAAHRAAHNPLLIGDAVAAREKSELAEAISQMKKGARKRELFLAMHALLERVRRERASELAAMQRAQAQSHEQIAGASIALDRTYICVLHSADALARLEGDVAERIARELAGVRGG